MSCTYPRTYIHYSSTHIMSGCQLLLTNEVKVWMTAQSGILSCSWYVKLYTTEDLFRSHRNEKSVHCFYLIPQRYCWVKNIECVHALTVVFSRQCSRWWCWLSNREVDLLNRWSSSVELCETHTETHRRRHRKLVLRYIFLLGRH